MLAPVNVVGTTPTAAVPPTTAATASERDPRREELRRVARSTPARMILLGALLAVVSVVAGVVPSVALADRAETLDTLLVQTEPFANSAQNLYGSLSVADAAASVPETGEVEVYLVWDPPWDMEKMSEEAKLALGFF